MKADRHGFEIDLLGLQLKMVFLFGEPWQNFHPSYLYCIFQRGRRAGLSWFIHHNLTHWRCENVWKPYNVGIAIINHPFLMVYTTHKNGDWGDSILLLYPHYKYLTIPRARADEPRCTCQIARSICLSPVSKLTRRVHWPEASGKTHQN